MYKHKVYALLVVAALAALSLSCGVSLDQLCRQNPALCAPPSAPPPVTTPGPMPAPPPAPTPLPSVPPLPPPTECRTPQLPSDAWEIINWGCEPGGPCPNPAAPPGEIVIDAGASLRFMPPHGPSTRDLLVREVETAITEVTGCQPGYSCQIPASYQDSHNAIAARLRAKGYCAGQHEDGRSDNIVVSTNPPREGLWMEVHQIVSGRNGVYTWGWGKINQSSALWRIKDPSAPSPSPTSGPGPTPPPTPVPPDPNAVASVSITTSAKSVKAPADVKIQCFPKNSAGQPLKTEPSVFFIGAQFGGPINKNHISWTINGLSAVLHVNASCPAGTVKTYCTYYPDLTATGKEVVSSAQIQVQP